MAVASIIVVLIRRRAGFLAGAGIIAVYPLSAFRARSASSFARGPKAVIAEWIRGIVEYEARASARTHNQDNRHQAGVWRAYDRRHKARRLSLER